MGAGRGISGEFWRNLDESAAKCGVWRGTIQGFDRKLFERDLF